MKLNKAYATVAVVLVFAGRAPAQTPAPPTSTLEVLLSEVRLLRQAIERQTAVVAKTQLLAARLSLQEQRLVRARASHEALETQITRTKLEEAQGRSALEQMEEALDDPARTAQRKDLESEVKALQNRLKSLETAVTDLQTRLSLASQVVEQERARLDDLEAQLLREDFSGRERR